MKLGPEINFPPTAFIKDVATAIIKQKPQYFENIKQHPYTGDLYAVIYMILFIAQQDANAFMGKIDASSWRSMIGATLTSTGNKLRNADNLRASLPTTLTGNNTLSALIDVVDENSIFNSANKSKVLDILKGRFTFTGGAKAMENSNPYYNTIRSRITDGGIRQMILTGAPGTGKTFTARKVAADLTGDPERVKIVQFHPSYDYTDFVEGIRPVDVGGAMQFKKLDGHFKAFCRKVVEANKEGEKPLWFFIVDEINRADLSKVFGELMFCLEKDKRGESNKIPTQYQNLPTYGADPSEDVYKDGFYIPENVVILGTMNDIDRSVESMDFALRRRFEWLEFVVTKENLEAAFKNAENYGKSIQSNAAGLAERVMALNEVIHGDSGRRFGLNRQYDISQGHFTSLTQTDMKALLSHVWEYRIRSTLREYLRGEDEDEIAKLIGACEAAFKGVDKK